MSPTAGDLLVIRRVDSQYVIVDARTREILAGPFDHLGYAIAVCHSMAVDGDLRIWQEQCDTHGAHFAPPLLLHPVAN